MLELEHGFRIVDVHAKLAPADGSNSETILKSPAQLEREFRQAGIVRAVVVPPAGSDPLLNANNAVARHAVDRPFVPFARINGARDPADNPIAKLQNLRPSRDNDHVSPEDIERYAYGDRFYGFTLDPATDGLPDSEVIDTLESIDLPMLVAVGEAFPPDALASTLLGRDGPVIAAHFGGYPLNRDLMREMIDLLSEHDNCYLDTSVVRYRDILERALREHPSRVLFGSGVPAIHPNVAVMEILTLDLPQDAMRRAFEKNPKRIIPALAGRE